MMVGFNESTGLRLLEQSFVIWKIRVLDSPITMGLAIVPMTLIYCWFFIDEVDGTFADDLVDTKQFCDSLDKLLILLRIYSIWGYSLGNLFFSLRAYLLEGAFDTWVKVRDGRVFVGSLSMKWWQSLPMN